MTHVFTNWLKHIGLIPEIPTIGVMKLDDAASLPKKAYTGMFEDAAYDLFSTQDVLLQSNQRLMVSTKVSLIIPNGYWVKLRERSGLANKGIHILGGVIDSGYTGEVKVIMYNSSTEPVLITRDKAICQFTVEKLALVEIKQLTPMEFVNECEYRVRGSEGFGSSDANGK